MCNQKINSFVVSYRVPKWWRHHFFAFHRFEYHLSMEHDEKHPQPKFGGNQFTGSQDMAAWIPNKPHWNQCKLTWYKQLWSRPIYTVFQSCDYISGHNEPIDAQFVVWGFFIIFYWNIIWSQNSEMKKKRKKNKNKQTNKKQFIDVTLQYSINATLSLQIVLACLMQPAMYLGYQIIDHLVLFGLP